MEPEKKFEEETPDTQELNISKIVIYIISFLLTLLLCYNSPSVSSLKFFYKALVYIVVFVGGVIGGNFGTWLNENFPYPINWVASKFNLEDSVWFKLIGAQVVGIIAGILLFGGIIAKIMGIRF